jgi:hypothetical protein
MIDSLTPLGLHLASPAAVTALIDTGAHTSVLNPEIVRHLGLRPVGVAPINTPSMVAPLLCNRFHINIYFPDGFVVENVFVIEAPMVGVPYQCLLGRDVLSASTLVYEGKLNRFSLTF